MKNEKKSPGAPPPQQEPSTLPSPGENLIVWLMGTVFVQMFATQVVGDDQVKILPKSSILDRGHGAQVLLKLELVHMSLFLYHFTCAMC